MVLVLLLVAECVYGSVVNTVMLVVYLASVLGQFVLKLLFGKPTGLETLVLGRSHK